MTSIRDAGPADADFLRAAMAALDSEVQAQTADAGVAGEGFPSLDVDFHLQNDAFLIATSGRTSCGFASIWFQAPPNAALNTLYVLSEFRRQGIATALLEAAEHKCRELGATSVSLGVFEGNPAALATYEKAGYRTTRRAMWLPLIRAEREQSDG